MFSLFKMFEEIKLKATTDNFAILFNWLNKALKLWGLSADLVNKVNVCAEEIFVNIASYAYKESIGYVLVLIEKLDNKMVLTFEDEGIEYNPLQKEDPDTTLSLEEREIGGLGIFMVKQIAKNVEYEHCNDKNRLKITFDTD